jgi:hypothetical protein
MIGPSMDLNQYLSCPPEDAGDGDLNASLRSGQPDLRRLTAMAQARQHAPTATAHPIVRRLVVLTERQHRELACAMSMLWDEFVSQVGGPAGWETCSGREQIQYIRRLGLAAERILLTGGSAKAHYALAPELMSLYVHALRQAKPSEQDREVAALAVSVAARGALIRRGDASMANDRLGVSDASA